MSSDVLVVGGGVIGVFIAHQLAERGARVTLLESATLGSAASYGNAGLIVPSFGMPMANPSSIVMGLRALAGKESAIKVGLRAEPEFWRWVARFVLASRSSRVTASTMVLCQLGAASIALYDQLFSAYPETDVGFKRRGWLYAYRTERGLRDGIAQARSVEQFGVSWQQLSPVEVRTLEPALVRDLAGGILYPHDGNLDPSRLVPFVAGLAQRRGVGIRTGTMARAWRVKGGRVQAAVTDGGDIAADTFVVAAGMRTPRLLRDLAPHLPIQPAKGYSLTFRRTPEAPRVPLDLAEAHVVVSPMGARVRITGGLDLVGPDRSMDVSRLEGIADAARSWLPRMDGIGAAERWYGFRPLSADGLPVIGPLSAAENVIVATGHGTLGVTLGPITGQLVADLIAGRSIPPLMQPLLPGRFESGRATP